MTSARCRILVAMSINRDDIIPAAAARERAERLVAANAEKHLPPAAERRAIRIAAGVSTQELAPVIGCCTASIILWEKGREPQAKHRTAYATALRVLAGG